MIASVVIDRTMASSSTIRAVCGSKSLITRFLTDSVQSPAGVKRTMSLLPEMPKIDHPSAVAGNVTRFRVAGRTDPSRRSIQPAIPELSA